MGAVSSMSVWQRQDGDHGDQYFSLYEAIGIKYSSFWSPRKRANISIKTQSPTLTLYTETLWLYITCPLRLNFLKKKKKYLIYKSDIYALLVNDWMTLVRVRLTEGRKYGFSREDSGLPLWTSLWEEILQMTVDRAGGIHQENKPNEHRVQS